MFRIVVSVGLAICALIGGGRARAEVVFESDFNDLSQATIDEWQKTSEDWRCVRNGCDFFWNIGLYGRMNLQSSRA